MIESVTHDMIIAYTYSKKVKGSGTDGIFLAMVDAAGKVTKYKNGYYEFPLNELQKFETARRKRKMEKKDDYEAPNIKVRNVLIDQAGGVLITCEEFYLVVTSSYSASTHSTTYYYTYHYEDILAAKVSADGKFEWLRKIPKMQKGTTTGGMGSLPGTMGYKLIADASGYYFLFLDNKKNVELAEDEAPKYHVDGAGGQVMVAKIDPKGVVSKELLFDTRDEDVMVFPRKFNQINSSQFIGRAKVNKKTFRPLLITVN
ncbi:MAG: hypothetical protein HY305_05860 [Sphingobacteriales bacterium]|nr:hypothetical protein [Sphingobacteriales bacterium]